MLRYRGGELLVLYYLGAVAVFSREGARAGTEVPHDPMEVLDLLRISPLR